MSIVLITIGSLVCVMAVALAYYMGFPPITNINFETFQLIMLGVLLLAIVMTLIALIVNGIYKPKE